MTIADIGHMMTTPQAAGFLKIQPRTLEAWRGRGSGPDFIRVGSCVRYTEAALVDYVNANRELPGDRDDDG